MPIITIIRDPANLSDIKTHDVDESDNLANWILSVYGLDGFEVPTDIYKGQISSGSIIDHSNFDEINTAIDEPIYIIHQPLGLSPLALQVVIAIVAAVAVTVLLPVPDIPGGPRSQKTSPNNALSGQTNLARTQDRVPDIFGKVKSYPDLVAPTVTEFIDDLKYITEYMCIGRGFYDVTDAQSGETPLDSIPGSSFVLFDPGTAPTEIFKTRQSNEVAGQELKAPNDNPEVIVGPGGGGGTFTIAWDSSPDDGSMIHDNASADVWAGFEDGDSVEIQNIDATAVDVDPLDGTYIIDAPTSTTITFRDASAEAAGWSTLTTTPSQVFLPIDTPRRVSLTPAVKNVGYFVVPGDNNCQVWLDFKAPKGIARGDRLNQPASVDIEIQFEEIDALGVPTGGGFVHPETIGGNTRDPRFITIKITSAEGLAEGQRYQVRVRRLTDSDPTSSTIVDELRWSRMAAIEDIGGSPEVSGTTRVIINTQATEQVSSIQERKFNFQVTRKTITWDGSAVVGDISTGAGLTASRRMADAFLHYALDPELGARSIGNIDAVAVFAIQDALDSVFDGNKGEFSFTFDNKDTPALEEMRIIAQAARCFVFAQGATFSMIRDEAQAISRGLFNRRNKLPDSESRAVRFNLPLSHDGVRIEYVDIDDDNTRVITFPDDLTAEDGNFGLPATLNPVTIDGLGIRQYKQAWDRAQLEFRKLINSRVNITTSVTSDGILLPLNARVSVVDNTRLSAVESDGEIKGVSGLTIKTSERCIFDQSLGAYSVIIRDDSGNPAPPIAVTAIAGDEFGFVLSSSPPLDIIVRGDSDYQRGALYSFAPDANHLASSYLVQRKTPDEDGNVELDLINYSDEYYSSDSTEPPLKT